MNTCIFGLLAETSIHPGGSEAAGVIDLPVAREAATDYPVIPGSSFKGALLGLAAEKLSDGSDRMAKSERHRIFGQQDNAGVLLVSDARLLLLPVRSLQTAYKWITCPHLLERFQRDRQRAGFNGSDVLPASNQPAKDKYLGVKHDHIFLEERHFTWEGECQNLVASLERLIPETHAPTRARLASQFVVLHDDDFVWFARHGLAVQARNRLDPEKKTTVGGALWYEETIPPDALFYALLAERGEKAIEPVANLFRDRPYLQVGGNETVGMGWFAVTIPDQKGAAA